MAESRRSTPLISEKSAEAINRSEELAYELRIEEVMTRSIATLTTGQTLQEVLDLFRQKRISGAPVLDEIGNLVGVLSLEDLIRGLRDDNMDAPVSSYMSPNPVTIRGKDSVIEALKRFSLGGYGRLPVVDEAGKLVGILTKGDITSGLLHALQKVYQEEEIRRYRAMHLFEDIESDRSSLILRYNIKKGDFTCGGAASSNIKRALLRMGASPQIARRVGIAVYEAEMNLIIHTTDGGSIRVEIEPHQISIDAYDSGPGIQDTKLAMKPGYSTATDEIRELGFGAGMGLANIQRCVDYMRLESVVGQGTRLRLRIFLQNEAVGEGYPATRSEKA